MATPEELAKLKGNPNGALNLPGVNPITVSSFQPNGPPDPGKQMQPAITLPDQMNGPELNPVPPQAPSQPAAKPALPVASDLPSAFPGSPTNAAQAEIEAHPPEPEEPIQFGSSPLDPIQKLNADAQAYAKIAEARRNEGKALAQGKVDEATIHSQSAQQQESSLNIDRQDMLKARAAADLGEKDIDAKIAKAEAMSVDPDRYWHRKGTANNIMAAIAIGLGSFASGLTGGATGNPALTLINAAIERDVDAQKADIDNYWRVIKEKKGLVDNAWNRALVMQNYNANAMLAGYKITESKLKAVAAKTDSEVVKAQSERMIAEMQPVMNSYRGQTWSSLAALEAEKRKQQMAGQAAAAANLDKLAKERDEQRKGLADKYADPNGDALPYDQALAKADQILDQNPRFNKLTGTKLASPGQQYKAAVDQVQSHYLQIQQGLNNKDPNKSAKVKDTYLKALMNAGLSYEDSLKQMKTLQSASPAQLAAQAKLDLNQDGVVSPYEVNKSQTVPGVIDVNKLSPKNKSLTVVNPNSGEVLTYPSQESANKAREVLVGLGEIKSIIQEMKDMRKQNSGGTFDPAQVSNNKVLQIRLIGAINQVHGGKLDEGERKAWEDKIPNATSYDIINDTDKRLDMLESSLTKTADAQLAGGGGQLIGKTNTPSSTQPKQQQTNTSGDPFTGSGGKSDPFTPTNPVDTDKQNAGKRNY